jgi:hypothetical protein
VYFIKSGRVKVVRDVAFLQPMQRYFKSIGNKVFKEDPLREQVEIDEYGNPIHTNMGAS